MDNNDDLDDERRDGYGYRIRNGLDPSPGDEIRTTVAAVLAADPEPREVVVDECECLSPYRCPLHDGMWP